MGRKRLKNNITLKNIWRTYPYRHNLKSSHYVSQKKFTDIAKYFFSLLSEQIIDFGYEYKLPQRMGHLMVRKFKSDKRQVDWNSTKKFFGEENKNLPKGEKKIIYHSNKHSAGYNARWWWRKEHYISFNLPYKFTAIRKNKRSLAKKIKSDNVILKYKEQ